MLKHRFRNIKKLNTKLMLCTIMPMLIILILAASTSIRAITNAMTQLSLQQLRTETISHCDRLSSYLSKYIITLSSKSTSYTLERYMKTLAFSNNPETNPYYYQLMDMLDEVYAFDPENISMAWIADFDSGIALGNSEANWTRSGTQWHISERPWYKQALNSKKAFISDPFLSLYNDDAVVAVIIPITDTVNQRTLGVLSLNLHLDSIQKVLESGFSEIDSTTVVIDSNKNFISHPDKDLLLQPVPEVDGPIEPLDSSSSLFRYKNAGVSYLGYTSAVLGTDWMVASIIENSYVTSSIFPLILQIITIFILSILLLVIIVFTVSRLITRPLDEITAATKELARGNYSVHLVSSSKDEVGQLAKAVNTTIQTLRSRAIFDSLTGIYNEFAFSSRTRHLISSNPDSQYALIRFDIVRFKMVNDMFGSGKGDELLRFIASVLRDHVSADDSYGRLMGDIFCICIKYETKSEIIDLIHRITYHVEAFPINFHLTPYFGVCLVNPEIPLSTLLDWSSLALSTVKGNTLTNYAFYDNKMREHLLEESRIENEMNDALQNKQFVIYLQPKCDISTSQVIGAEALVRWIHPRDGIIRPDLFIPIFEKNGFIIKLDEYIWEETCKIIHSWKEQGYPLIPVSVNISRVHIFDPEFCDKITNLVHKYDIPLELLELEFTESAFMSNMDTLYLYKIMEDLRKRGFVLSMDDFGSGYSSLNMLKNSPVDIIKIDREFLNESTSTENGRVIIRNTISMLRQLKLQIIAEGVETREQADFLLSSGCSIAQGYYYSKPIDISSFEEFAKFI